MLVRIEIAGDGVVLLVRDRMVVPAVLGRLREGHAAILSCSSTDSTEGFRIVTESNGEVMGGKFPGKGGEVKESPTG
ncbi:hypothetical protein Mro03_64920 [Microbispora rosea subsp. rosea]|nr:hypothetical protein Mro03_64920 [Microbispora rosea subsp. rosea]